MNDSKKSGNVIVGILVGLIFLGLGLYILFSFQIKKSSMGLDSTVLASYIEIKEHVIVMILQCIVLYIILKLMVKVILVSRMGVVLVNQIQMIN